MGIIEELRRVGFCPEQTITYAAGLFVVIPGEAAKTPPPLVYVIVDRNGESVKTGRSKCQNISQRHGSLAAGMNGTTTIGQNTKQVVLNLKKETIAAGSLVVYVKHCETCEDACRQELDLFDRYRGRIDRRRG